MLLNNLFEALARTGQGKTAVVGWGRGMGHKGHMMLASSVITKAKEVGGDPYFVVSRTVGKDDPLTADEKLAIYKKVFPQQGHVFQAASDEIPNLTFVLTDLNKQGYDSVVVVVGADQVKAFQYLKNYNNKPDKSGNVAFKFKNLEVISRQETGDPSAGEEGPRATPMRAVLNDPSATPQQQFQVWRDAMSPEVSDEEVRDLMTKAKERMGQFAAPKKKGVTEFAMSGGDDEEDPTDNYPCYDCGSTIFLHHTKLCELAEDNAIRDLPSKPGSQHWTGEVPKGLQPIPGLGEGVAEAELDEACWKDYKQIGMKKKGGKQVPNCVPKEGVAVEPDPKGYQKDLLTTPKNSLVIDTPGDLDWYKLGQHYPTLGTDDPHEYGQGDSDMMIIPASKKELAILKQKLDRLKMRYKDIGGGHEQPEIHDRVEEKMLPASAFAGTPKNKLGPAAHLKGNMKRPARAGDLVGSSESVETEAKIKGADGKACWKGYKYAGTKNGKDKCVPIGEAYETEMSKAIALLEGVGDKPSDPGAKEFVSNKFLVKFVPDALLIYKGGELIYKKLGDYSTPKRSDVSMAKSVTSWLWEKYRLNDTDDFPNKVLKPSDVHNIADKKGIPWDNDRKFLNLSKKLTGKSHLDKMSSDELRIVYNYIRKIR